MSFLSAFYLSMVLNCLLQTAYREAMSVPNDYSLQAVTTSQILIVSIVEYRILGSPSKLRLPSLSSLQNLISYTIKC